MLREGLEWTLFDTPLNLEEVTAPTVIPDNTLKLYAKDKAGVSALFYKDDAEVEHDLSNVISGSGAVGQVAFFDSASTITGENNLFWDATNNRLGIGSPTPLSDLEVITTGSALPRGIAQTQYSGDGNAPGIQLRKARGTEALPTVALLDDPLGEINFFGYTGSAFTRTALIQVKAAENYSATNQGSYFRIFTIPAGSTTLTERWHFGPEGQFGIGGATYGSLGNVFTSGGVSAAPTWSFPDSQYFTGTNWVDLTDGGATTLHKHDHGGQDGLSDDDHSQYALLAGRSGSTNDIILSTTTQGQIAGSSANGQNLKLTSTTHATKSKILFGNSGYDEVNNKLGIGTSSPGGGLTVLTNYAQFSGDTGPTSGAGVELGYDGTKGYVQAYSRDASAFKILRLNGSSIEMAAPTTFVFNITTPSGGQDFLGNIRIDATDSSNTIWRNNSGAFAITNSGGTIYLGAGTTAKNLTVFVTSGNIGIGNPTDASAGTNSLILKSGTALGTLSADTAGLYVNDIVAGNAAVFAKSEAGDIIKLYKVATYTPTNVTTDRSFDADTVAIAELADVVGTLISDLQTLGFLG